LQFRKQIEGSAAGADEMALAAHCVESGEPATERACILIPGDAGVVAQGAWRIGTEQLVGLHGHGGDAVARRFKDSG
jgi:hypothetical protein